MYQYVIYISILFLYLFSQEVFADNCGDDITCAEPYQCCESRKGCCYDQVLHTNRHLRLQIWNLWYFWFLIIFMMMSCFGGCGYYRRRRLAFLTRPIPTDNRSLTLIPPNHRVIRGHSTRGREFNLLAYSIGGQNPMPVSNLPPSYAEIIENPNMYPATKIDLPPYSAPEKPEETRSASLNQEGTNHTGPNMSLPPPYSECQPPPPPSSSQSISVNNEHQDQGNSGPTIQNHSHNNSQH